jgi:hypothetical protein
MSYSTSAYLFFGVSVDLPEDADWDMIDGDDKDGIKMIHYGSDGDSMYAVAIAVSITAVDLGQSAPEVEIEFNSAWAPIVRSFCKKHGLVCQPPHWRLAVSRF